MVICKGCGSNLEIVYYDNITLLREKAAFLQEKFDEFNLKWHLHDNKLKCYIRLDIARCDNCYYEQKLIDNKFVSELFKLKLIDKDYIIVNSYIHNILKFSLESDFNYAKYLGGICDWKIVSDYIKIDNISRFEDKFKLYCMLL